jgi:hypothetical protein
MILHDALTRVAESLAKTRTLRRTILEKIGEDSDSPFIPSREKLTPDMSRELHIRKSDHECLMASLASDPILRANMIPWMIDFEGDESPAGVDYDKLKTDQKVMLTAANANFGTLPKEIRTWITGHGFEISDSGSSANGWHLGVPCTDLEAALLCKLAHEQLETHLDAGVLTVSLKFWGWRFRGLYTEDEAEAFLAERTSS